MLTVSVHGNAVPEVESGTAFRKNQENGKGKRIIPQRALRRKHFYSFAPVKARKGTLVANMRYVKLAKCLMGGVGSDLGSARDSLICVCLFADEKNSHLGENGEFELSTSLAARLWNVDTRTAVRRTHELVGAEYLIKLSAASKTAPNQFRINDEKILLEAQAIGLPPHLWQFDISAYDNSPQVLMAESHKEGGAYGNLPEELMTERHKPEDGLCQNATSTYDKLPYITPKVPNTIPSGECLDNKTDSDPEPIRPKTAKEKYPNTGGLASVSHYAKAFGGVALRLTGAMSHSPIDILWLKDLDDHINTELPSDDDKAAVWRLLEDDVLPRAVADQKDKGFVALNKRSVMFRVAVTEFRVRRNDFKAIIDTAVRGMSEHSATGEVVRALCANGQGDLWERNDVIEYASGALARELKWNQGEAKQSLKNDIYAARKRGRLHGAKQQGIARGKRSV